MKNKKAPSEIFSTHCEEVFTTCKIIWYQIAIKEKGVNASNSVKNNSSYSIDKYVLGSKKGQRQKQMCIWSYWYGVPAGFFEGHRSF